MTAPLILIHGFGYDPREPGPDHPEHHTYPRWREMLPEREVVPFAWFSDPGTWDAWRGGRWNRYRYAWDLAERAGGKLATVLAVCGPSNIVCHSLGSRVVVAALRRHHAAERVLILNGAEYSTAGETVACACPGTRFYNVVVPADDVLNILAKFAPGRDRRFLGNRGLASPPSNWQDLRIDDVGSLPYAFAAARNRLPPAGDNSRRIGDHWYSFENEANWPLYRAIFSGEWDRWITSVT